MRPSQPLAWQPMLAPVRPPLPQLPHVEYLQAVQGLGATLLKTCIKPG